MFLYNIYVFLLDNGIQMWYEETVKNFSPQTCGPIPSYRAPFSSGADSKQKPPMCHSKSYKK